MKFYGLIFSLFLLFPVSVFGQIEVEDKIPENKPIVVTSKVEADVYLWEVPEVLEDSVIYLENQKTLHIWAPKNVYELKLTTLKIDWEKKTIDYSRHRKKFSVGDNPNPN